MTMHARSISFEICYKKIKKWKPSNTSWVNPASVSSTRHYASPLPDRLGWISSNAWYPISWLYWFFFFKTSGRKLEKLDAEDVEHIRFLISTGLNAEPKAYVMSRKNIYTMVPIQLVDWIVLKKALTINTVAVASPSAIHVWKNWALKEGCSSTVRSSACLRYRWWHLFWPVATEL